MPDLTGSSLTPAGRDIPRLPSTETYGDNYPREGWRSINPNPNGRLLGEPDVSIRLGTNQNQSGYTFSSAGFTRETDPFGIAPVNVFAGQGGTHGRVLT